MASIFTAHSWGFDLRFEHVKWYSCFKFISMACGFVAPSDDMNILLGTLWPLVGVCYQPQGDKSER